MFKSAKCLGAVESNHKYPYFYGTIWYKQYRPNNYYVSNQLYEIEDDDFTEKFVIKVAKDCRSTLSDGNAYDIIDGVIKLYRKKKLNVEVNLLKCMIYISKNWDYDLPFTTLYNLENDLNYLFRRYDKQVKKYLSLL